MKPPIHVDPLARAERQLATGEHGNSKKRKKLKKDQKK